METSVEFVQLVEAVEDLASSANSMSFFLMVAMVALVVIACRMPKSLGQEDAEDKAPRRRRNGVSQQLAQGVGGTFEVTFASGIAQFGGLATNRVTVLDYDGEWVLLEAMQSNKPRQAVVRVSEIAGLKEIVGCE